MEDKAQQIHQDLRGKECGRTIPVVIRRNLHQVHAHHLPSGRQALQEFQDFIIEKATMARRAGAWRYRWVKAIDIHRDIIARTSGHPLQHALRRQRPELADRQDIGPGSAGSGIVLPVR